MALHPIKVPKSSFALKIAVKNWWNIVQSLYDTFYYNWYDFMDSAKHSINIFWDKNFWKIFMASRSVQNGRIPGEPLLGDFL